MSNARDDFFADLELLGFVPEVRFHPTRRWRFDMAEPETKCAVEYSGIMGGMTAHTSIVGVMRDAEKYTEAQLLGWVVVIATAPSVRDGKAMDQVIRALEQRGRQIA